LANTGQHSTRGLRQVAPVRPHDPPANLVQLASSSHPTGCTRRLLTTGCVQPVPPCCRVKHLGRRPRLRCGRRGGRLRGRLWFSSLFHTPGKVHEPPRPPSLDEGPLRCLEVLLTKA